MGKNSHFFYLLAIFVGITVSFIIGISFSMAMDEEESEPQQQTASNEGTSGQNGGEIEYNPPSLDDVPDGPIGEEIKYGHQVINETNTVLDGYVGNNLTCSSCHGDAGLDKTSSFVGVSTQFPQYRPREGVIFTLEDRINGCMTRSMNGEKIPYDSKEMRAMISYLTYISQGIPEGADLEWRMLNTMKDVPEPNVANGEEIYKQSCIACHAADGSGTGPNTGPAVWGPDSFNEGAGMARMTKMAGYVKRNMPKGQEGTLTDQEAADVSAYLLSHERPEKPGKENDWPKGGAPKDVPYYDELKSVQEGLE
ncbi:c-type cytochrome [Bacillus marinisedimentorum]|uniref:c-type cytochrome n=1 Tax=Bacillus marinisedimentorum TaxID=1821260 RepID=UPI0007DFEE7D|nr:c-type cytochrome [Bacillus marinisedimentorum]